MGYKDFKTCFVCRTQQDVLGYKGDKEVTMLLNSLLALLCLPVEEKKEGNTKIPSKGFISRAKDDFGIVINCFGNSFNDFDVLNNLRNGIAHLNIRTIKDDEEGDIKYIQIYNRYKGSLKDCNGKCEAHCKTREYKYKQYDDDKISDINCEFEFTPDQLKEITLFVADEYLNIAKQKKKVTCEQCKYKPRDSNPEQSLPQTN